MRKCQLNGPEASPIAIHDLITQARALHDDLLRRRAELVKELQTIDDHIRQTSARVAELQAIAPPPVLATLKPPGKQRLKYNIRVMPPVVMRKSEVAEVCGVCERTVDLWVKSGLPAKRGNKGAVLILRRELFRFMRAG